MLNAQRLMLKAFEFALSIKRSAFSICYMHQVQPKQFQMPGAGGGLFWVPFKVG